MLDTSPLWAWVNERHAIYVRKTAEERGGYEPDEWCPRPDLAVEGYDPNSGYWTHDEALQKYRYCNVFRELDRVTDWIRRHIREPYAGHPDLWLMLAIARYINWPETLQSMMEDNPEDWWLPLNVTEALERRAALGEKVYTGAYMIRAESNPNAYWYSWSKHRYIAEIVIGRLWEDREQWRAILEDQPEGGLELQAVWMMLQAKRYIGWGPFMAYQVVVDMRHTDILRDAPDINTWAALGPGSRRGLNRLAGRDLNFNLTQEQGLEEMLSIHAEQDRHRAPWVPPIELSDIQNALCETDKYLRVKRGEGRPRAQYVPGRGY